MAASSLKAPTRAVKTISQSMAQGAKAQAEAARKKTAVASNFKAPTGKMNGPSAPKPVVASSQPAVTSVKFTIPIWARWLLGALCGLGLGYGIYKKTKK